MIDARIPLMGQPAQIDLPSNALLRNMRVQEARNRELDFQQGQEDRTRALADENRMREIMAAGGGEGELLKAGLYKPALALGKNRRENEKIDAESAAKKFEVFKGKLGLSLQQLGTVQDPGQAQQWYAEQVRSGLMPMQTATEQMRRIPADPQGFAQWRDGMLRTGATAIQQLEQRVREQNLTLTEGRNAEQVRHNRAIEENNRLMRSLQGARDSRDTYQLLTTQDAEGNPVVTRVRKQGDEGVVPGVTPPARRKPEDVQTGADYNNDYPQYSRDSDSPSVAEYRAMRQAGLNPKVEFANIVKEAKRAVKDGKDPDAVRAKLKSFGIDPNRLTQR